MTLKFVHRTFFIHLKTFNNDNTSSIKTENLNHFNPFRRFGRIYTRLELLAVVLFPCRFILSLFHGFTRLRIKRLSLVKAFTNTSTTKQIQQLAGKIESPNLDLKLHLTSAFIEMWTQS